MTANHPGTSTEYLLRVRRLTPPKALAVAAYGESVAAYRYRTLLEKADLQNLRQVFKEMADEEQGHHVQVQQLMHDRFPDADFVLTPADKELVIAGPRMIDVTDERSFRAALSLIHETEMLTGRFYAALRDSGQFDEIKGFLDEMATECFEHAKRLEGLPVDFGAEGQSDL